MYKFRSMGDGADARLDELREHNEATGPLFKMQNDPRVTRLDLLYIENWSVGFDMALLMRTVPAVLLPEGAY